jgi:hypothetical protein
MLRWISCVVIESSFDPAERLQAPGSLWFYFLPKESRGWGLGISFLYVLSTLTFPLDMSIIKNIILYPLFKL